MAEAWSEWPAPAKLNLFLHIVGRRADGYHLLQTVFQLLDWGDRLRLRPRGDGVVERVEGPAAIPPEVDLCVRAACALRERLGTTRGVDIALDKRIPTGGGLGGGSSDAATVLVALNRLWNGGLDVDDLAEIGLGLGADVPVFVRGRSAWAEGVGERLTPLELSPKHYVILDPREHVPTAELFRAPELTRNTPQSTILDFVSGAETANAFEPVVRERYPRVARALDWLGRHGAARLSGSGGCVFVAVDSAAAAAAIARECPPEFGAYTARGVNRSPLLDALAAPEVCVK
ncbi:MAG TPA: 4-(cytidine 5'-diphospho)-2-C-methyl-D-erythritol kinase [Rudaea sp.]|nr:4-(cytidine 5'-diphospho)-2-C-methyl-D-erythritol kinase [Rudaea sp.]